MKQKYEALIAGLWLAKALGALRLKVHSDSQLIMNQVLSEYTAKDRWIESYLVVVKSLKAQFDECNIKQVPRSSNTQTDALTSLGSTFEPSTRRTIPIWYNEKPSIEIESTVDTTVDTDDWRTSFVAYLWDGALSEDKSEARKIKTKAARFSILVSMSSWSP